MRELVDGLHESWINGNRKDVVKKILGIKNKAKACLAAVYLFELLDHYEQGVFSRMLDAKVP